MAEALAPEERDLLAAELALGVLSGEERALALRLQLSDALFRAAVLAWEARFAGLIETAPELAAPDLWPAIEARLPAIEPPIVAKIGRRLEIWRLGALTSGAIAAALALMVVMRPGVQAPVAPPTASGPVMVAQLGESGGAAQLAASYDPGRAELRVRAVALPSSPLSPELWVIPAGGAPQSLGLIATPDGYKLVVPAALRPLLKDGATLAVTMEKREGAPHAAPSSAPIAAGTIHKI